LGSGNSSAAAALQHDAALVLRSALRRPRPGGLAYPRCLDRLLLPSAIVML